MKRLENVFERTLWASRFLVVIAVIASIILALIMFFIASIDVKNVFVDAIHFADPALGETARGSLYALTVANVARILDGYLFASILVVFAFGLYELFVSRIDIADESEVGPRVLQIRSLDDLKERLATLVFLILVIRYFEFALQMPVRTPVDLLELALGIALIAVALYFTKHFFQRHAHRSAPPDE